MSDKSSRAPSRCASSAVARPMPLAAPVIRTTLPSRIPIQLLSRHWVRVSQWRAPYSGFFAPRAGWVFAERGSMDSAYLHEYGKPLETSDCRAYDSQDGEPHEELACW